MKAETKRLKYIMTLRAQNLVMGVVVILASSLTMGCRGKATQKPPEEHALLFMFTDEGQGKIGINSKIIEAKPGTLLTVSDCSSEAGLRAKGAKVSMSPSVSARSGEPCSLFVGSLMPGSKVPREGRQIDLLCTMDGKEIRYSGSVITWTPASQAKARGGKVAGNEGTVGCTNSFAGECRIGEPVLVKRPDSQLNYTR